VRTIIIKLKVNKGSEVFMNNPGWSAAQPKSNIGNQAEVFLEMFKYSLDSFL